MAERVSEGVSDSNEGTRDRPAGRKGERALCSTSANVEATSRGATKACVDAAAHACRRAWGRGSRAGLRSGP